MHLHNVQQWLTGQTTWGVIDSGSDVRTLRRLNKLYDRLSVIGEITVAVMLVGLVCASAWLLTQTSFEDVIFFDSTDHICVLDSRWRERSLMRRFLKKSSPTTPQAKPPQCSAKSLACTKKTGRSRSAICASGLWRF